MEQRRGAVGGRESARAREIDASHMCKNLCTRQGTLTNCMFAMRDSRQRYLFWLTLRSLGTSVTEKPHTAHARHTHTTHNDTTGPEGGDCMLVGEGCEIGSALVWLTCSRQLSQARPRTDPPRGGRYLIINGDVYGAF